MSAMTLVGIVVGTLTVSGVLVLFIAVYETYCLVVERQSKLSTNKAKPSILLVALVVGVLCLFSNVWLKEFIHLS